MTKMPDKIYANADFVGTYWLDHNPDPTGELNRGDTEYTRSDLITQPVTDEEKVKALEELADIDKNKGSVYRLTIPDIWGLDSRTNDYIVKLGLWVGSNLDTIKAALSQPIPVQDELEALKAENAELSIHLDGCRGVLAETEERERALIAERDALRRAVVDLEDNTPKGCPSLERNRDIIIKAKGGNGE